MDFLSSFIYGLLQGSTEFLPVSSSGHLAILPHYLDIKDPGVFFDLMMHLGTALAVIFYFQKPILCYLRSMPGLLFSGKNPSRSEHFFIINFMISTLVSVMAAFVLKDWAESYGRHALFVAINLTVFGVLMYFSDRTSVTKGTEQSYMETGIRLKEALLIGLFQVVALFPGVSRSGITLTTARFLGLSRVESTEYSFLLSLPLILGGVGYKVVKNGGNLWDQTGIFPLVIGVLTSFIVGLVTIHYFLKFVRRAGLAVFTIYRIILALLIVTTLYL